MTKAQREQLMDILREVIMDGETDKAAAEVAEILGLDLSRRELELLETRIRYALPHARRTAMEELLENVLRAIPASIVAA